MALAPSTAKPVGVAAATGGGGCDVRQTLVLIFI